MSSPTSQTLLQNQDAGETSPTNPSSPASSPPKAMNNPVNKENQNPSSPANDHSRSGVGNGMGVPPKSESNPNENVLKNLNSAPPVPIGQRGRVVSLDRGGYMNNLNGTEYNEDDDDDDDISSSSVGSRSSDGVGSSDGEGSYFSEHLPSPPRRRESLGGSNPRLLPPGASSGGSMRKNNRTSIPPSFSNHNHHNSQYSASHESDLSLSSSSCEENNLPPQNRNLNNPYAFTRTKSAPVNGVKLQPRNSSKDANLDLSYHSDNRHRNDNGDRDKLKVIGVPLEEQLNVPIPQNGKSFPSTSSLVSSSSEDVERKQNVKPSKHRRQSSYRSVGSITSAGSFLPEKPMNMSEREYDNLPSKPPELVSFGGELSRHSSKSSSKKSSDQRIPTNKSYNDPHKVQQQVVSLNDDQMNTWRSGGGGGGISRSDSYLSSSHGNGSVTDFSPDRRSRNFNQNASLSNGSKHSSHMSQSGGSGIFIYSEDDTDESIKMRQSRNLRETEGSANPTLLSDNQNRAGRQRSFGNDLTNAEEIEPTARNSQINPIPNRRAQKFYENHSGSISSSNNQTHRSASEVNANDSESHMSRTYTIYWRRWVMLMYMSLLNLLSDWTCFSVAPIALLTKETFQIVNPEHLVTIFLLANTLSTATEPILLARLGLRKTIVFGAFLLMSGNVIKSAGIPGLIGSGIVDEADSWRLFVGFFLVGLSQPLYQCTPSILSSSWFPEKERTLATGVALNSNQLGIGCSFIFGSLLVVTSDDISNYFGILSVLSSLVFLGCYLQFQDAPPTPPSETARVMKGNMMFPSFNNVQQRIPYYFRQFQGQMVPDQVFPYHDIRKGHTNGRSPESADSSESKCSVTKNESESTTVGSRSNRRSKRPDRKGRESPTNAFKSASRTRQRRGSAGDISRSSHRRQRSNGSRSMKSGSTARSRRKDRVHGLAPSPAPGSESTSSVRGIINDLNEEAENYGTVAPSFMMSGRVGHQRAMDGTEDFYDTPQRNGEYGYQQQYHYTPHAPGTAMSINHRQMHHTYGQQHNFYDHSGGIPDTPFANLRSTSNPPLSVNTPGIQFYNHAVPYDYRDTPMQYYPPNINPHYYYQAQMPVGPYPGFHQGHHTYRMQHTNNSFMYDNSMHSIMHEEDDDEGVEPILTHAGSSLSINIRDDQILRSIKACFSRPGFVHTVIAFAVSGIVLNTISTYMDSLLSPSGAGRGIVGLIGGLFQVLVMISSIFIGRITDKKRAYHCVVIVLLVLGAFALAECAINLEAERGNGFKWTLLILAIFVGPLQPVATELGVEV